jgi:signal transduction histidine kinase
MKLLEKTNRSYFLISGTAFILAGAVIYFVLSALLEEQLNEKLTSDIEDVKRTIAGGGILPEYYPFIETREVPWQATGSIEKKDTLIFDPGEEDNINFRQISAVYSINGKYYFIATRNELFENSDLLATIIIVIASVLSLLLLSLYFINKKLSLHIWQPFYKTLEELKDFSHDRHGFKLSPVSEPDEFIELNTSLEKLTQKIITDYQSLKRFTEDASHEIQTPLAVIQSKLETLLQHPDLKKDQAEIINSAYVSVLRISKLTQTLLLLTKIANDQYPEKRKVDMAVLLEEKIKLYEDHIAAKSLTLNLNISPGCFPESNLLLAESLIVNLVGNAVKHCNTGGNINIILDASHFEISNTGPPHSVPASKLFERFYKADKSTDSQGLGLSIVKEICSLNKWDVRYQYEDDLHKFIVIF